MMTKTNDQAKKRPTIERKPTGNAQPEYVGPAVRRPDLVGGPLPVPEDLGQSEAEPVPESEDRL